MKTLTRPIAAMTIALACGAAIPAIGAAKAVEAQLRVQGGGNKTLDPGTRYRTDSVRVRSTEKCGPTTESRHRLRGPTALGIIEDAASDNRRLRPFRVSDTFGFGLIACQIGDFAAFTASRAWLYKVNHESPDIGGDQLRLRNGDQVLWYFANFDSGNNTGDELVLRAPRRVEAGEEFEVRVHAFSASGKRAPAAGTRILGGDFPAANAAGRSEGTISSRKGFERLRAVRGDDIPSAPRIVCERGVRRCP